jgi:hypothetical protein
MPGTGRRPGRRAGGRAGGSGGVAPRDRLIGNSQASFSRAAAVGELLRSLHCECHRTAVVFSATCEELRRETAWSDWHRSCAVALPFCCAVGHSLQLHIKQNHQERVFIMSNAVVVGFVAIICITLSACANGPILMQNPKTGQVFECAQAGQYGKSADDRCAKTLEAQGWTRIVAAAP